MLTRRHPFMVAWLPWAAAALVSTSAPAQEIAGARQMVPASMARQHVGEDCRVLFQAVHGGKLNDGPYFISSTKEAEDPQGFWVLFSPEALEAYRKNLAMSPEDVTSFYAHASVRVDGKIVPRPSGRKGLAIFVKDPDQLELQEIAAENAGNRVGEFLRVRMTVNLASPVNDGKILNLHSMKNWEDPQSLWVVVGPAALNGLRKIGIPDPVAHYDGKTILVEGLIVRTPEDERKRTFAVIEVNNPLQIEIVTAKDRHAGRASGNDDGREAK